MEKKTIQSVPIAVRDAYGKAIKSRADLKTLILLMKEVVKKEPGFIQAREKLRSLEHRKMLADGALTKFFAQLGANFKLPKVKALTNKDPEAAMALCEDALAATLANPTMLTALSDAAENAGAVFVCVEALSLVRELQPRNEANLRALAAYMQQNNQAREALKIFQEIAARHPKDLGIQSEVRAALALASMERGKWEESGSTQEKTVDAKEAVAQQILEGTIHDASQARFLVDKLTEDLKAGDSVDIHRKLAEAYMVMEDYDQAIAELEKVAASIGSLDPFLDKSIEEAVVARFDKSIREAKKNPGPETEKQIAEFHAQRDAYRLERARERVRKYPNDAQLNYDLAIMLFEQNLINEAIAFFQTARKSPQRRLTCMVYLGRCFSANQQFDMAIEQFESVLKEMDRMDKAKLETLYYLANTLEAAGQAERAIEQYKEIYQNQANFLDVAERIQHFYDRKSAAPDDGAAK